MKDFLKLGVPLLLAACILSLCFVGNVIAEEPTSSLVSLFDTGGAYDVRETAVPGPTESDFVGVEVARGEYSLFNVVDEVSLTPAQYPVAAEYNADFDTILDHEKQSPAQVPKLSKGPVQYQEVSHRSGGPVRRWFQGRRSRGGGPVRRLFGRGGDC